MVNDFERVIAAVAVELNHTANRHRVSICEVQLQRVRAAAAADHYLCEWISDKWVTSSAGPRNHDLSVSIQSNRDGRARRPVRTSNRDIGVVVGRFGGEIQNIGAGRCLK